jgi:hypothetical protein
MYGNGFVSVRSSGSSVATWTEGVVGLDEWSFVFPDRGE